MKKYILTSLIATLLSFSALADVVSVTLPVAGSTNLLTGYGRISTLVVTATVGTNAAAVLYDSPTNTFTYVVPAYTNILTYVTNLASTYTNYYGVVTSLTNSAGTSYVLVDVTNTVPQTTNTYVSYGLAAPASTSVTVQAAGINLMRGGWVTNTSLAPISITAIYTKQ